MTQGYRDGEAWANEAALADKIRTVRHGKIEKRGKS
jgi:hypothetical protein